MSSTSATSIQPGANVVQLRPRNECLVTAALADYAARVRSGDIVGISVIFTTADGVVSSEKLCSPRQASRDN